jgi:hypothetical protein
MKFARFDPPGANDDLAAPALRDLYSEWLSERFDIAVESVTAFLQDAGGGTCQFYNPVSDGRTGPDLPESAGDITWKAFPKRFDAAGPGQPPRFAEAEPPRTAGQARLQDEYLEWFVHRDGAGKITRVDFTCEAYDYFEFLAAHAPDRLLDLYRTFISPDVQRADLFVNGTYDVRNRWNSERGAMHLTHAANNLFAEVFLAASATVRRKKPAGAEHTSSIPLINCAEYGVANRNSDPAIGFAVNGLARQRRAITLANPVGLYIAHFDGAGVTLDGASAASFFKVTRGTLPRGLRATFEPPPALAAQGKTVSDVRIGGRAIAFGGELAQRITMHLFGAASAARQVNNTPARCGAIPQTRRPSRLGPAAAAPALVPRTATE